MTIQGDRLVSLIEFAQESAKLLGRDPVSVVSDHGIFDVHEHQLVDLPGVHLMIEDEAGDEVWMAVDRLHEIMPPAIQNKILGPWVQMKRSPRSQPALHSALGRSELPEDDAFVSGEDSDGDSDDLVQLEEYALEQEVKSAFAAYLEQWDAWAREEQPRRETIAVYSKLFTLNQELAGGMIEAQIELVWGSGVGIWRHDEKLVQYPLLAQLVELTLDPESARIEIRPRDMEASLEIDWYASVDNPGVADLEEEARQFFSREDAVSFSPFDRGSFEPILRFAVAHLDANGVYWPDQVPDDDSGLPPAEDRLRITDTWVVFARPRTGNLLIQDLEKFKAQAMEAEDLPPPVSAVVTDPSEEVTQVQPPHFRGVSATYESFDGSGDQPKDLFFPKPYNAEQQNIVEQLEVSDGVVVQGPPGTGKTHTIANIICHYLAEGKRVLVTSMKDPALAVLRSQLPDEIQPLAISLLTSERDGMKQFEHAISKIASEVQTLDRAATKREISHLQRTIDDLHAKLARTDRQVGDWAKKNLENLALDGDELEPIQAAREVLANEEHADLIPDTIGVESEYSPQFSNEDGVSLRDARRELEQDIDYLGIELPELGELPEAQTLLQVHQDLSQFQLLQRQVEVGDVPALADASGDLLARIAPTQALIAKLRGLRREVIDANEAWADVIHRRLRNLADSDQLLELLAEVGSDLARVNDERRVFLERPVASEDGFEMESELVTAVRNLADGKSAFGLRGIVGKSAEKEKLERILVLGKMPTSEDDWAHVDRYFSLQLELREIAVRWNAVAPGLEIDTVPDDPKGALSAFQSYQLFLKLKDVVRTEDELQRAAAELLPTWQHLDEILSNEEYLNDLEHALQHHDAKGRLAFVWSTRELFQATLEGKRGRIVEDIKTFLSERLGSSDVPDSAIQTEWARLMDEFARVLSLKGYLTTVQEITDRIVESGAPEYARKLREPIQGSVDTALPDSWRMAWRIRRLATYLASIDAHQQLRELGEERRSLETKLGRAYRDSVEKRTWLRLSENASNRIRAALAAYLGAIQKIGKGTGKRAIKFRRDARAAATEANPAVPCWIMPHYRVSESLPAELGCFDLVIIDEASQSDLSALPALLRAKKVLIVGDDKQVSPAAVGMAVDQINSLEKRFLGDQVPLHRQQMTPPSSIYDLFKIVFAGTTVMLKEHFRSAPPIIEFSKREFYNHELRPLRVPGASERLDPPLINVLVEDGYRKGKENPPEAKFIVNEIKKIINDPEMNDRSIGVVSLLGAEQAWAIWNRLTIELGPETIESHQILCGDAPTFQGNERDIMFLSMVASPTDASALSGRMYEQRFNVAASRAKDRMYLVRSVEPDDLSEKDVLRRMLIAHFTQPFAQNQDRVDDLRSLCESDFERDAYDDLTERGYWVTPQVRVSKYRIDMVVEGHNDMRLAIEWDGDSFHGPERWADDIQRQRILERAGWVFWRCFASAFYLRRGEVLADLMGVLADRGIEPIGGDDAPKSIHTEQRRVVAMNSDEPTDPSDGIHVQPEQADDPDEPSPPVPDAPAGQPIVANKGTDSSPMSDAVEPPFMSEPEPTGEEVEDSGIDSNVQLPPTAEPPSRLSQLVQQTRALQGHSPAPTSMGTVDATSAPPPPLSDRSALLPDPVDSNPAALVPGIVEILRAEGPMTGYRLRQSFVKAAGGQRVGGRSHKNLNKAISRALSRRLIEERDELETQGYKDRVFRIAGAPYFVVRPRGEREFLDIPPSEVAALMSEIANQVPQPSQEDLFRTVMERYETKKMTRGIQARLEFVYARRDELVGG